MKCNEASDKVIWDGYINQFKSTLDLAHEIWHSPYAYKHESDTDFDISPRVWALLSLISMSCLRRRAQSLLNVHHKRCGHDDDDPNAQQMSLIFAWEEAGVQNIKTC